MERDQGIHELLKPLARTSISEEIGRRPTGQGLHPSSVLAAQIPRSFGLLDWFSRLQWSQVNWPSIILILGSLRSLAWMGPGGQEGLEG